MGVLPLTLTLSVPLAKLFLPVPVTLCSAGLEVLVPKVEMFPQGDTTTIYLKRM